MVDVMCAGCGRPLRLFPCRIKPHNFCSRACADGHQYLTNGGWLPAEDAILKEWYRVEGSACHSRLPDRNINSISTRATRLGIRSIRAPARTDDEWQERFWSYVNRTRPDECWPWTGNVNSHGYGTIRKNFGPGTNRSLPAHAVAWHLRTGEDPAGRYVLHRCGNRFCCNPAHLYIGDAAKNAADRDRHGRTQRGEQHYAAVLTEELVMKMRQMASDGARYAEISRLLSIPVHLVNRSVSGATWKHLPGIVPGPGPGSGGPRKITHQEVAEARRMARAGRSLLEIANFLKGKVGEAAIRLAITGRTWKSVDVVEPPVALK